MYNGGQKTLCHSCRKEKVNLQGHLCYTSHPIPSRVLQYVSLNTRQNQHLQIVRATVPHIVPIKLAMAIQNHNFCFSYFKKPLPR